MHPFVQVDLGAAIAVAAVDGNGELALRSIELNHDSAVVVTLALGQHRRIIAKGGEAHPTFDSITVDAIQRGDIAQVDNIVGAIKCKGAIAPRHRRRIDAAHRAIAKITLPIWLFVSVTGVLVYLMLYRMN